MVSPTCFGITLPSSGRVPSAYWEMLNWGVVDRILWMAVLCLVMWCVAISVFVHLFSSASRFQVRVICNGDGTRWRSCLRQCATSRKVAGLISDCVLPVLGSSQPLTEMSNRYQAKDVQQILKGAVRVFIVLNRLPRHVSASKCHLQGVTVSFHNLPQFRL
jgi:hypothetical protein